MLSLYVHDRWVGVLWIEIAPLYPSSSLSFHAQCGLYLRGIHFPLVTVGNLCWTKLPTGWVTIWGRRNAWFTGRQSLLPLTQSLYFKTELQSISILLQGCCLTAPLHPNPNLVPRKVIVIIMLMIENNKVAILVVVLLSKCNWIPCSSALKEQSN